MDILILRVGTWSYVSGKSPALQLFCVDSQGRTIYLNIPYVSTYLLTFPQPVSDGMFEMTQAILEPDYIKRSEANPSALIVSGLTENEDIINDSLNLELWTSAELNPASERVCLSYLSGITGEYISVRDYQQSQKNLTYCDFEITASPFKIAGLPDQQFNYSWADYAFLYDIEVYTPYKDFVNAERKSDEITSISGVINHRSGKQEAFIYTNGWTKFDPASLRKEKLFSQGEFEFIVRKFNTEKDLLIAFFDAIRMSRPTCLVDYNGLTFDMPYIRTRAKALGVSMKDLSMIRNLDVLTENIQVKTSFQIEMLTDINLPGVPHIDLIYYYKAMFPYLPNHRLETVSRHFIGQGKTGMSIAEFYNALVTQDPDLLRDAAEYSLRDSVALAELWVKRIGGDHPVGRTIFSHAANTGVNPDRAYALPEYVTFKYLVGKTDLGYMSDSRLSTKLNISTRKPYVGIYANLHTYSYIPLLLAAFNQYSPSLADSLAQAPAGLMEYVFYHPVTGNVKANEEVKAQLAVIADMTVLQSTGIMVTNVPLQYIIEDSPHFRLLRNSPMTVFVTQMSRLEVDKETMEVVRYGTGAIIKPKYKLLTLITESVMATYTLVFAGLEMDTPIKLSIDDQYVIKAPTSQELKMRPFNEFLMSEKIQFSDYYGMGAATKNRKTLALQMEARYPGININNMAVKWIMTPEGPRLYEGDVDMPEEYNIDYGYYQKDIAKALKIFNDFTKA